jgi:hypothetical protein
MGKVYPVVRDKIPQETKCRLKSKIGCPENGISGLKRTNGKY